MRSVSSPSAGFGGRGTPRAGGSDGYGARLRPLPRTCSRVLLFVGGSPHLRLLPVLASPRRAVREARPSSGRPPARPLVVGVGLPLGASRQAPGSRGVGVRTGRRGCRRPSCCASGSSSSARSRDGATGGTRELAEHVAAGRPARPGAHQALSGPASRSCSTLAARRHRGYPRPNDLEAPPDGRPDKHQHPALHPHPLPMVLITLGAAVSRARGDVLVRAGPRGCRGRAPRLHRRASAPSGRTRRSSRFRRLPGGGTGFPPTRTTTGPNGGPAFGRQTQARRSPCGAACTADHAAFARTCPDRTAIAEQRGARHGSRRLGLAGAAGPTRPRSATVYSAARYLSISHSVTWMRYSSHSRRLSST